MSNAWKNSSIWSDLSEIYVREAEEARAYIEALCRTGKYTVILFGSRGRGDSRVWSDWDILVVGYEWPPTPPGHVDLHFVRADALPRLVEEFNTIVIDAFYKGKPVYDALGIHEEYTRKVAERVRGLKKTREGWLPSSPT